MTGLDVTILTGISGAGRSTAADVLEDLGFFVIDNLPPALIPKVVELAEGRKEVRRFVAVVDVRSGAFMHDLEAAIEDLRGRGVHTRVVFVDATDAVLVRRFEETRRPHPLGDSERVLDGITTERRRLEGLKGQADLVVDTSNLHVHALRDRLHELFEGEAPGASGMQVNVVSFGYKHGVPIDVDLMFDCRFLPNPHWIDGLRDLTGRDQPVRDYVLAQDEATAFLGELQRLFALLLPAYVREGKSYLSIAVGCTGGRHRSVVMADEVALTLRDLGFIARVDHRDVDRG